MCKYCGQQTSPCQCGATCRPCGGQHDNVYHAVMYLGAAELAGGIYLTLAKENATRVGVSRETIEAFVNVTRRRALIPLGR